MWHFWILPGVAVKPREKGKALQRATMKLLQAMILQYSVLQKF